MDFQNATKRDKPNLPEGTLIYARVAKADKFAKPQLTCISLIHKKAWNSGETYFGQLTGGFVKEFPVGFCRRLLGDGGYILERFGTKMQYDIDIGYNGKIWVKSARMVDTIFIFNALERIVEMGEQNIDFIMDKLLQE
jgi:exosome complex component RRP40